MIKIITLYKAYKYDNSYDYIKTFTTKEEQNTYFNSLDKIYYDEQGDYIREHEPFNIEFSHQYLVENSVNYIKFNNGYRDVYGFIIEKRYVNDEITEIIFEIDVIQTFMFDFSIQKSFIERKVCSIDEISDYDEGLEIGEHEIKETLLNIPKEHTFFAMFNGIKQQQVVFRQNSNVVESVIDLPFPTNKPLTSIDNIQYPCYFMPLKENYPSPTLELITNNGGILPQNDVVASARKLLGLPYIFGGNYPPLGSDIGTDCSGLCQWAYNDCNLLDDVGLSGRWTTYTMIEHFTYVTLLQAKIGDMIFSNFSSPGVPEHVALISGIQGNSISIIEAQQPGTNVLERTIQFDTNLHEIRRAYNL